MVHWEPGRYCYKNVYKGDSALLVLNGTSLNSVNALLTLGDNLVFKRDIYFLPFTFSLTLTFNDIGCVHMGWNHVPKDISERDSALSWFESLILAHVNAKLFQIRLLKRVLKCEKRAFWIVICLESLILGHVNAKLFRNVIRACAFWKKYMRAEAVH